MPQLWDPEHLVLPFEWHGETVGLFFGNYAEGRRTALIVMSREDETCRDFTQPELIATVNMPEVPLGEDEVLIKDYSENAGILKSLTCAGLIEYTGRTIPAGYAEVHVCRLLLSGRRRE